MIQHIVMWTFKDGIDKEKTFNEINAIFESFKHKVPGMKSLTLYRGFQGFDVCLISIHEDKAALDAYQVFPEHEAVKVVIANVREERASCDFEI